MSNGSGSFNVTSTIMIGDEGGIVFNASISENNSRTVNETIAILTDQPTASPTIEDIDAAEETHQFDADAALFLNITLICCIMLVSV